MLRQRMAQRAAVAAVALATGGSIAAAPVESGGHAQVPQAARAATTTSRQHDLPGALTAAQRQVIRQATARYRDVDNAVAAGYVPTDICQADPALGGMGYHYVRPDLAGDPGIDPALPEILVYAPDRHAGLRLAAIEYFKVDGDGDLGTDEDRPTLFGEPFDGPMAGHEPGQPVHYDIHTWVWRHNPAGELAQFNPAVRCPESTS